MANRNESLAPNPQEVAADVEELYKAGQGKIGTNETVFLRIFTQRSIMHLRMVDAAYGQKYEKTLKHVIEKEFGGHVMKALKSILDYTMDRNLYFAELLDDSMKGSGTKDKMLIRNVAHMRGPMREEIKTTYLRKYGKSLLQRIASETSGDYKKLLLEVVGQAPVRI